MRLLVFPRDANPYQGLLYQEMERLGVQASYLGELTSSQTLNLLLLPLELGVRRIGGARLVHLHWVFTFSFPGAQRFPAVRWLAYGWFVVWLKACRVLRMRLIWTAHNVMPHEPVFGDDTAARRALVRASDLVLAHSESTLAELSALGAVARRHAIIQHGPMASKPSASVLRVPGTGDGSRRFLFFGRIQEYKGVQDLLVAFLAMPDHIGAQLTIAGQCDDLKLKSHLRALARRNVAHITLRTERVPDDEAIQLFAAADVVVLPFRRVTTSGSAMLALSYGRPLIVPNIGTLAELPGQVALRYDGQVLGLSRAMTQMACADGKTLTAMSAAASSYAYRVTWKEIAQRTAHEMSSLLGKGSSIDAGQATGRSCGK
jgi:glycosyltransferase involved in cell wall biosynthesis